MRFDLDRHAEHQYLDLLDILLHRPLRPDRTGTGTHSLFGYQMRFPLQGGRLPLLTTKQVPFRLIAIELLWFLSGSTNAKVIEDQGCNIWKEWGNAEREMGPIYGAQWRSWRFETPEGTDYIDQIQTVVDSLREDPYSRRHIVSAWNPGDIDKMALPPCHCLFQFYVEDDGRLSCQLYQRSADVFLGLPFNIASYAMLTMMMAKVVGREPGEFVWTGGDVHLYANHVKQAKTQLRRAPLTFPRLDLADRTDMDSWQLGDLTLRGYVPGPAIPAPVSP